MREVDEGLKRRQDPIEQEGVKKVNVSLECVELLDVRSAALAGARRLQLREPDSQRLSGVPGVARRALDAPEQVRVEGGELRHGGGGGGGRGLGRAGQKALIRAHRHARRNAGKQLPDAGLGPSLCLLPLQQRLEDLDVALLGVRARDVVDGRGRREAQERAVVEGVAASLDGGRVRAQSRLRLGEERPGGFAVGQTLGGLGADLEQQPRDDLVGREVLLLLLLLLAVALALASPACLVYDEAACRLAAVYGSPEERRHGVAVGGRGRGTVHGGIDGRGVQGVTLGEGERQREGAGAEEGGESEGGGLTVQAREGQRLTEGGGGAHDVQDG